MMRDICLVIHYSSVRNLGEVVLADGRWSYNRNDRLVDEDIGFPRSLLYCCLPVVVLGSLAIATLALARLCLALVSKVLKQNG
jgi:hypothetical protein